MSARILFVCTANSARSQMAEGLARALALPAVEVASAGTRPSSIHPQAIEAMRERGIDIGNQRSKRIDEVGGPFDYVVTLCDDASQACPALPARRARLHWSLPDPAAAAGDEAERLRVFRQVRDEIERRLSAWLAEEGLAGDSSPVQKVRQELARYEHPLFLFEARPAGEGVEVAIRYRPPAEELHTYLFQLRPREIEHSQFPWTFQKQLYDCLHDYLIEMFTRNPQEKG
jgi:arsenate reductase (thioredoxin)